MEEKNFVVSGKRKTAVAKAKISPGTGKISINKKKIESLSFFDRLQIEEPLRIAEAILGKKNFDVSISTRGGGEKGQIEAARLSLAKAILLYSKSSELKEALTAYDRNLLVADVRRKEAYKPDDSKARSKRQSSKR
jgi:small subunit ribosomal protein S9